jgi:serine/threonine protein kinase
VLQWTGPPTIQDLKALKTDFGKEMLEILTKIKPVNKKEWFNNCPPEAMDLLTRTLCFNPEKRLTMLEIIRHAYVK